MANKIFVFVFLFFLLVSSVYIGFVYSKNIEKTNNEEELEFCPIDETNNSSCHDLEINLINKDK